MKERRQHRRLPVMKDLADPIELSFNGAGARRLPGVITNMSAGGMDLVLLQALENLATFRLALRLPGCERMELSAKLAWQRPKGLTSIAGISFIDIHPAVQEHITRLVDDYWTCEDRVRDAAPAPCVDGCAYMDLCEKAVKRVAPPALRQASGA